MIDDVLDIMRSEGRLMEPEEIRDALIWRDPVRYRTATRAYIIRCINDLKKQGFDFEVQYTQIKCAKVAKYRYLGVRA